MWGCPIRSWKFTCTCQRESAGPGVGWGQTDPRAPTVRTRALCPRALLLSAGEGAYSISTPSVAKLEKGQGMKEDIPDPNLSSQALGPGEGLCVCVMCMRVCLCVRVCFPELCVSVGSCCSALHPGLPLSCAPPSSGNKAGFTVPRDGDRYPGCTGVRWGMVAGEGGVLGRGVLFVPNP